MPVRMWERVRSSDKIPDIRQNSVVWMCEGRKSINSCKNAREVEAAGAQSVEKNSAAMYE